ncbi:MAG: DUF4097 family beta strand repeat-containing protein [Pseudomonadota bacterium]
METNRFFRLLFTVICLFMMSACASYGPPENGVLAGDEKRLSTNANRANKIVLEVPSGDVRINATHGSQINANLEIRCDTNNGNCLRLAERVKLEEALIDNVLYIRPTERSRYAFRHAQTDYRIDVPANTPLKINMGFGALRVAGLRNELIIDMSAGDIDVEMARSEVRTVWADANFGDAQLVGAEGGGSERRLLVGAEADWRDGKGAHDIIVNLGAGDITVTLTE